MARTQKAPSLHPTCSQVTQAFCRQKRPLLAQSWSRRQATQAKRGRSHWGVGAAHCWEVRHPWRQSLVLVSPFSVTRGSQIWLVLQSESRSQGTQRFCLQSRPTSQSSLDAHRRLQSCVVASQYSVVSHEASCVQGTQRPSWQERPEKQSLCWVHRPQKRARKQDFCSFAQSSSVLHCAVHQPSLQR